MRFVCFLILIPCILIPQMGFAQSALKFEQPDNRKARQALAFVAALSPHTDFTVAAIDLNDDFIDEFIVKDTSQKKMAIHYIVAYENRKPILIGEFQAQKLLISTKKDYGIKQLILYNNSYNDFSTQTARWDPDSFFYDLVE